MDEPSSSHQCLVCTASINSTRFGLDACRACASFFKRSKVNGQKFTCRQGDKNCSTSIDAKFTCRGCRFEKCTAIGMVWDGPLRIRKKKVIPILKRIKLEWKALLDRRREQELKIIKQHGGHTKLSHPTEEIFYVHPETYSEIYRIFIEESYAFFKRVYPSFSELSNKEQELIFKDYIVKMGLVEGHKRSMQLWGGGFKHQMYSVSTCIDFDRLHFLESETSENKNFAMSYTQTYAIDLNKIYKPMFTRCEFTEQEYYALMALVMYEIDIPLGDISEEAESIINSYRREALEEIQLYYRKELCLSDFSTRLGNLMSANHAVQEWRSGFKVFYRFFSSVFDVIMADKIIRDFYL